MKKISLALFISVLGLASACSKTEEVKPVSTAIGLVAVINGANQAPTPNNSTATGEFDGTYDSAAKLLTYTITFRGMTPTIGHFHLGAPGVSGGTFINFPQPITSPIIGSATLTADQADKLLSNGVYVNLHSAAPYQAGEIRGDIKKK